MLLRPMLTSDFVAVAALSEQLGYPTTPDHIRTRFEIIRANHDNACFVAEREAAVIGWVHVYGVHLLESPASFAEIGGLVVDVRERRQGVGQALMGETEKWAASQGYLEIRLRSGLHRTDAHQFYQSIGYTLAKTSHLFLKDLTKAKCERLTSPLVNNE